MDPIFGFGNETMSVENITEVEKNDTGITLLNFTSRNLNYGWTTVDPAKLAEKADRERILEIQRYADLYISPTISLVAVTMNLASIRMTLKAGLQKPYSVLVLGMTLTALFYSLCANNVLASLCVYASNAVKRGLCAPRTLITTYAFYIPRLGIDFAMIFEDTLKSVLGNSSIILLFLGSIFC